MHHPNAILSNQLNVLSLVEHNYSKASDIFSHSGKHYKRKSKQLEVTRDTIIKYQINGRENHRSIHLIGDKRGGTSSRRLFELQSLSLLAKTKEVVQIPLKIIHVVRNPFDNITTMVTRAMKVTHKHGLSSIFTSKMDSYFTKVETNQKILSSPDYNVFTIHLEDFNRKTIQQLFDFLSLPTSSEFLNDCTSILWTKTNRSSQKVDFWTSERINAVKDRMRKVPFLSHYTFD